MPEKFKLGRKGGEIRVLVLSEIIELMMILKPYAHTITPFGEPVDFISILLKEIGNRSPFDLMRILSIFTGITPDDIIEENDYLQAKQTVTTLIRGFAQNNIADLLASASMLGIFKVELDSVS